VTTQGPQAPHERTSNCNDPDFARLVEQAGVGAAGAFESLVTRYGHHVYRAVRRKLGQRLRSRFDSDDFVQAVWASFYENRARLLDFRSPEEMVRFLATVARNKVADAYRRPDPAPASEPGSSGNAARREPLSQVHSRLPTPSQVAMARERFNLLTPDEATRAILGLRATGATYAEISRELRISPRTVRRVIERARGRALS
jgi:RNA polymerase sigma factor (sigma-70 family)